MKTRRPTPGAPLERLAVCSDGYLRLPVGPFRTLRLVHQNSELDVNGNQPALSPAGASLASIDGYTEWSSPAQPALALAWDWRLDTSMGRPRYERVGEVRSNLMLLEDQGGELGEVATEALLCIAIDTLDWQPMVDHFITERYAWRLASRPVQSLRSTLSG